MFDGKYTLNLVRIIFKWLACIFLYFIENNTPQYAINDHLISFLIAFSENIFKSCDKHRLSTHLGLTK